MEKKTKNFLLKKKLLIQLYSNELNKDILYHINEARNSPRVFAYHLSYVDDNDKYLKNLYMFFNYFSKEVHPLLFDKNLSICSQDLLTHLISLDDGKFPFMYPRKEKMRNSLKERLKKLNLIPINYNNFIIIGTNNSLDAIINLFLNEEYRNKILNPQMNLIGIASGLLPSENLCIVIDVVNSIKVYDYFNPFKYNFIRNGIDNYENNQNEFQKYNYNIENNQNNQIILNTNYSYINENNKSEPKIYNIKKGFNPIFVSPNKKKKYENNCFTINNKSYKKNNNINDVINLEIVRHKTPIIKREKSFILQTPKSYKIPISICIDKQYIKDKEGKFVPIYTKESTYDDGSILLQPNI